jgi:hypothetical protein
MSNINDNLNLLSNPIDISTPPIETNKQLNITEKKKLASDDKQENITLSSTWIEYVRLFFLSISNNFCYVLLIGIFTKKYKKKIQ